MSRVTLSILLGIASAALAGCTQTHVHVRTPSGERPPAAKVLVLQPDVELYRLSAGGVQELQPEWTAASREYVAEALGDELRGKGLQTVAYAAPAEPERRRAHQQLLKLHDLVGGVVRVHLYVPAFQLPTKGDRLDWTLGRDAGVLREDTGADYAVFVFLRDSYSTGGRVALAVAYALLGAHVAGGTQVGFASLVDLRTGNFLWFNQLIEQEAGDLRSPGTARRAVVNLLTGFPR